jgi:outer membrane protein TolC
MGVSMAADLTLSGEAGEWSADIPPLQTAFADAVRARPDILSAEAGIRAQQYALSAARAVGKPVYSLGGQASKPFDGWDAGKEDWSVSAQVSWALLDGGASAADRQSAEASLASARATLLQMYNEVVRELENGLVELQRTGERVAAAEKSHEAARAQLGAARARYQNGLAILLEVTQARRSFTSAGATRVRARYEYSVALVALHSAMGTLPVPGASTSDGEATHD